MDADTQMCRRLAEISADYVLHADTGGEGAD